MRTKLRLTTAALQIPIGAENDFKGVVDLVTLKAYYNEGSNGYTAVGLSLDCF